MSKTERAAANRGTKRKSGPVTETRERGRPISVYASADDRAEVERLAFATNCTVSDYVRLAALGVPLRDRADAEAVLVMVSLAAAGAECRAALEEWLSGIPEDDPIRGQVRALLAEWREHERELGALVDAAL
jgi:hypothetical protein